MAGLSAVVLTIVFRRWRHLLVFLCSLFLLEVAITLITSGTTRPRPYGVLIIGNWAGYSTQAVTVAVPTFLLISIAYCLVVPGRPRSYAKAAIAVVVTMFCLARLYLAVDHLDDLLLGVALAVAIPVSAFRFFTPNAVFPVAYRRGNTAHVDVTGLRGDAIRQGTRDQLGLNVTEITPVGLESSAGSTPLRLRTEGGPQEYLFAKLYTKGHVRADRWYKIWRTILYGSLEDEHPFQTVRRLAEYEDYALRLLQDAGIAVPRPYGIVEITPEREYLLVTEFFDGAVEIGDADLDDQLIDQGLSLIRTLWDAGIAHRDIKPGNLMVRALPSGWTTVNDEIVSGRASFGLDSGSLAGGGGVRFVLGPSAQLQTVTITLTATCDMAGARQVPSGQPGMRRFERPPSLVPGYSDVRYDVFPGGCVTYRFVLGPGASPVLATAVGSAVAFMPRSELVGYVRRTEGLALCGRGAGCPG